MARFATPEDEWKAYLDGTHPHIEWGRRVNRLIPSDPRCRVCHAPFGAPGSAVYRPMGFVPWSKNPNMCTRCITEFGDHDVLGAEVEVSFLFADVRRSSELARTLDTMEFTRLMQRFYSIASDVLLEHDAILDKFVGDEVVGFFLPLMAGPDHAGTALRAAHRLLEETGHADDGPPWLPLGAGVNTGTAFVGMVSSGQGSEFTAFGDVINVAAHIAARAAPGEILVTEDVAAATSIGDGAERRRLSLKGLELDALVIRVAPARGDSAATG